MNVNEDVKKETRIRMMRGAGWNLECREESEVEGGATPRFILRPAFKDNQPTKPTKQPTKQTSKQPTN